MCLENSALKILFSGIFMHSTVWPSIEQTGFSLFAYKGLFLYIYF